jgi:hypothetical protein
MQTQVKLGGEARTLQFFAMRSMRSGGVFRTLRYDNLAVAVKKILRGYQPRRNRAHDRLSFALGLRQRILPAGARQRKRWGGDGVGLVPE